MNLTDARWNGHRVVFADYASGEGDEEETQVVALYPTERGVRQVAVTTGEQEGGSPLVAAIGFANADADSADELIVILTWHVYHAEVSGTLYDIRIFDDPRPEQTALRELRDVGRMFESGSECECESADGPPEHYAFKTIAAVKAELRRRGF